MARIGFLGLGTMGRGMADNLVKAGHDVTVWNRSAVPEVAGAAIGLMRMSFGGVISPFAIA